MYQVIQGGSLIDKSKHKNSMMNKHVYSASLWPKGIQCIVKYNGSEEDVTTSPWKEVRRKHMIRKQGKQDMEEQGKQDMEEQSDRF